MTKSPHTTVSLQVQQFSQRLKSQHEDERNKAARDLHHFVLTKLRDATPEYAACFTDELNRRIFEMTSSEDINGKKGGILAMACLMSADACSIPTVRYVNLLRNYLLPSNDVDVMRMAAWTVGKLSALSGSPEYVEFEVKRAFEWLSGSRVENRRYAAVLVLKELAEAMPTYFFQQVAQFFELVFNAVRDQKAFVREAAADSLRATLVLTAQREGDKQALWYEKCYDRIEAGLEEVNLDDRIHGSLLVLNELLRCSDAHWERRYEDLMKRLSCSPHKDVLFTIPQVSTSTNSVHHDFYESVACKSLIMNRLAGIVSDVMNQRHSRNAHVQKALMILLPRLAAFDKKRFVAYHLQEILDYLLLSLRGRDKIRGLAFTTVGLIAVVVGDAIEPHLHKIMEVIRATLQEALNRRRNSTLEPTVFVCIGLLSHAVGQTIAVHVKDLLEPMMDSGLSPELTKCLRELASCVPSLKTEIEQGLLQMLSMALMYKPYCHPGTPWTGSAANPPHELDVESTILALRTLRTFSFGGKSLLQFVRRCSDLFSTRKEPEIRLEAVKTCSFILRSALSQDGCTITDTATKLVGKLLEVGVTDTDSDVRYSVFESLDKPFDLYLAQAESLSCLFIATNDEVLEIREMAIRTTGRLSSLNPACVMPSLRKTMIQLLTELEHSGMSRNKELAARLLNHLVVSAPRLVQPYTEPILKVLVPKLKEPESNSGVILAVLRAIGDLAGVSGADMQPWMPELLSILLKILVDASSSEKRAVALWVLGQLIGSTGHVVKPYMQHPALLDVLLSFLKTEQQTLVRRETIRVLGLLGALDPYKYRTNLGQIEVPSTRSADELNELLVNSSSLEEYYPAVAIATLVRIIREPTLAQYHTMVVQAVTFIFKSLGMKCVQYISQVMPNLLNVLRTADASVREYLLQQLAILVVIVKQHIRDYLDGIFALVQEFWTQSSLQGTLINLIEHVAVALGAEFKVYLPRMLSKILRVLGNDATKDRAVTIKILSAFQKFAGNLDDYKHLVLPPVIKLFQVAPDCPMIVARCALETVEQLVESLDLSDFASRIIQSLVRTLDQCPELRVQACETLCALVMQLGPKFQIFLPVVERVTTKHKISHLRLECLIDRLQNKESGEMDHSTSRRSSLRQARNLNQRAELGLTSNADCSTMKKLSVNPSNLRKIWMAIRRVSRDDWLEWLRSLSIILLKESPSPALRSCYALAQTYSQLPRDLFNAAFVCCWIELDDVHKKKLMGTVLQALNIPGIPEITQTILNLAEFMEHCDLGPLPFDRKMLGDRAMQCQAYAKALHYKENEFHTGMGSGAVFESLISVNNKLQQKEAAEELLEYAMNQKDDQDGENLKVQVRWYEKLHNWDKALSLYRERIDDDPENTESTIGEMRCLEALGEWGQLYESVQIEWPSHEIGTKQQMAKMAASAAWGLNQWDSMKEYVTLIPKGTQDGAFYRAVLAIHDEQYKLARGLINDARDFLYLELKAMAGESYQRAYNAMVKVQKLVELEEVIQYKLVPEKRSTIRSMWWERLQGGQRIVEDWKEILQVRTLVVPPRDDMHTWLKYASLCRKSGYLALCHKTLNTLFDPNPAERLPQVTFAYCKYLWVAGQRKDAYVHLQGFVSKYLSLGKPKDERLIARCYLRLGDWLQALQKTKDHSIPDVLAYYTLATEHDPGWYKAWHAFACVNFDAVLFYKNELSDTRKNSGSELISKFAVPALKGFTRSINLSRENSLQDTLRLMTLWFEYGQWPEVYEVIMSSVRLIEINTWLQVIPQLIARIDTPRALVGRCIHNLLVEISKSHPQALVYPLMVASKSASNERKTAANKILASMSEHSATLVQQAKMVSDELIRTAILWHELWHAGLEEASRLYFGDRNVKGMLDILEPLHAMLKRGPETLNEVSFSQAHGRDLMEAQEWCSRYKISNDVRDINRAWELYYHVFHRIARQMSQITVLELQYVSPKLLLSQDLELAVPGSYKPGQPVVRIASIHSSMQVISSKQKPRKLSIKGSNGKDYVFLLKGHEDLRQDERVMQLFGLVNTLLLHDPDTFKRNLTIHRYAVIPLSTNSGLIGWVPLCDTLHVLLKDYREKKGVLINIEHQIMLRMAPDYDRLLLTQKVEVFEHALASTKGDDLARLLWLKSPSSEVWFDRRTNYTCSLAVMSMVGYILGLGDRHPSNLMLDRLTGKIIHIDFGDCFEVAMKREKFSEKIPFRLTRMLVNAMEVTGIEGTYRRNCESVMTVLHKNKDSLMAVLEAFVYDPLLNWRLMDNTAAKCKCSDTQGLSSVKEIGKLLGSLASNFPEKVVSSSVEGCVEEADNTQPEALNKKALQIINRVRDKLTGYDFPLEGELTVQKQVDLLIQQATKNENLCQCYIGWCPFW